jgi:hypothetical protein
MWRCKSRKAFPHRSKIRRVGRSGSRKVRKGIGEVEL